MPSQVQEGFLGERGHGVAVESEQREVRHAVEGRRRQHAQQVETQVQHLESEIREVGWCGSHTNSLLY